MLNNVCVELEELNTLNDYSRYLEYEADIYESFEEDFIEGEIFFKGKKLNTKKFPMVGNRTQSFYHITTKDYDKNKERNPDFKRLERLHWIKDIIQFANDDFEICENCDDYISNCSGYKIWSELRRGRKRIYIFLEIERYIIIIEDRTDYYILITAYYIDYDNELNKFIKKAAKNALF